MQWYAVKKKNTPEACFHRKSYIERLNEFNVNGINAFFSALYFELNLIVFTDLVDQTRSVNKDILTAVLRLNETITFGFIEKFNCAFLHYFIGIGLQYRMTNVTNLALRKLILCFVKY